MNLEATGCYIKAHYLGVLIGSTTLEEAFAKCAIALELDVSEAIADLKPRHPEDLFGLVGYKFYQHSREEIEIVCK